MGMVVSGDEVFDIEGGIKVGSFVIVVFMD